MLMSVLIHTFHKTLPYMALHTPTPYTHTSFTQTTHICYLNHIASTLIHDLDATDIVNASSSNFHIVNTSSSNFHIINTSFLNVHIINTSFVNIHIVNTFFLNFHIVNVSSLFHFHSYQKLEGYDFEIVFRTYGFPV
jgi:hypothetical protein